MPRPKYAMSPAMVKKQYEKLEKQMDEDKNHFYFAIRARDSLDPAARAKEPADSANLFAVRDGESEAGLLAARLRLPPVRHPREHRRTRQRAPPQ